MITRINKHNLKLSTTVTGMKNKHRGMKLFTETSTGYIPDKETCAWSKAVENKHEMEIWKSTSECMNVI